MTTPALFFVYKRVNKYVYKGVTIENLYTHCLYTVFELYTYL